MPDNNTPAFPSPNAVGLTKREWFAGMALSDIASLEDRTPQQIAAECFAIADAMIEACGRTLAGV